MQAQNTKMQPLLNKEERRENKTTKARAVKLIEKQAIG
jgi:hypothetical protein